MVICLEWGADLHMAQLMPLPPTVSCFSKIQIGFTFLVPAHPGCPGQRAVKRVCVCCVREMFLCYCATYSLFLDWLLQSRRCVGHFSACQVVSFKPLVSWSDLVLDKNLIDMLFMVISSLYIKFDISVAVFAVVWLLAVMYAKQAAISGCLWYREHCPVI